MSDPNSSNNNDDSSFLGSTHSIIHDGVNSFQNTLKQRKTELEELREQEHQRLMEIQARIAKIDAELKETNHWLKKLENNDRNEDNSTTTDIQPYSPAKGGSTPFVFGNTPVPNFEPSDDTNNSSQTYENAGKSGDKDNQNIKHPVQVDLAPNTQFVVDKMSDLMAVSAQALEQINLTMQGLDDKVNRIGCLLTNQEGISNTKFETLKELLNEMNTTNKSLEVQANTQRSANNASLAIRPIMKQLEQLVGPDQYPFFEMIVQPWLTPLSLGKSPELKPIFYYECNSNTSHGRISHPSNKIYHGCCTFAKVLHVFGVFPTNQIINYSGQRDKEAIKNGLDDCKDQVVYIPSFFSNFGSDVFFVDALKRRAKTNKCLLVIHENAGDLERSKNCTIGKYKALYSDCEIIQV